MNRKLLSGLAAAAIAVTGAFALTGSASAAVDNSTALPANGTVLPQARRIVPFPGMSLNANQTVALQVAGQTFESDAHVPADATGVVVSITSIAPEGNGNLRVWTTGAGTPSTGAVYFHTGEQATNLAFVALGDGKINVQAIGAKTKFVLALMSYYTPLAAPPVPTTIAANEKALENIGPSVRTDNATPGSGVTDLGHVTLPAGTYDTRVIGGFSGLKNTADIPAGTFLEGFLAVTKGAGIPAGFGNVLAQTQGVEIPKTNSSSATYTIDPTIQLSTFITLTESTDVHVQLYAYSSNGVDYGSTDDHPLGVKANIASAKFLKIS
jgi:hypothetical protein